MQYYRTSTSLLSAKFHGGKINIMPISGSGSGLKLCWNNDAYLCKVLLAFLRIGFLGIDTHEN